MSTPMQRAVEDTEPWTAMVPGADRQMVAEMAQVQEPTIVMKLVLRAEPAAEASRHNLKTNYALLLPSEKPSEFLEGFFFSLFIPQNFHGYPERILDMD
jgi:hypothetical protein